MFDIPLDFASNYPTGWVTPPTDSLPKAWTDKLASVMMPNISVAQANNGYPTYAQGESGADEHICSFTYQCTTSDDLVNPPDGVLAVSSLYFTTPDAKLIDVAEL